MKLRKLFALSLSVIMILAIAGCGKSTASVDVGADDHLASTNSSNGKFSYTIVRAKNAETTLFDDLAKKVRSSLKKTFSGNVSMEYDTAKKDFDGKLEIIIGETNRKASEEALKELKENRVSYFGDFIVKASGDKICINAVNNEALELGVDFFIDTFCNSKDGWNLLYDGYKFIYEAELTGGTSNVGETPLSSFTIIHPRDMELIYGNELTELCNYLSEKQGYVLETADDRTAEKDYEVLVGNVNRSASKEFSVDGDNYIIKTVDKKLVIKGGSSLALMQALKDLKQMFVDAEKKGGLSFEKDFEKKGSYSSENKGYAYTWGDEFNTGTFNHYWWVDYDDFKYGKTSNSCLGGKLICKATENAYVKDGNLVMYTDRINDTDFTRCTVSTFGTMMFRYGLIEIRAKLAEAPASTGLWAFTNQIGYGGMTEYDILENFGKPDSFATNIHRWWSTDDYWGHTSFDTAKYKDQKRYTLADGTDKALSDSFHVYSMEWTDGLVAFAVDGKPFFSYSLDDDENVDIRRVPAYFLMSTFMGSADYGSPATLSDPTHQETLVDYVRLYQRNDIDSQLFTRDKNNVPRYNKNGIYTYEYH